MVQIVIEDNDLLYPALIPEPLRTLIDVVGPVDPKGIRRLVALAVYLNTNPEAVYYLQEECITGQILDILFEMYQLGSASPFLNRLIKAVTRREVWQQIHEYFQRYDEYRANVLSADELKTFVRWYGPAGVHDLARSGSIDRKSIELAQAWAKQNRP